MDKNEYQLKLDEMTRYVEASDYKNALQIAESIDWRRVKSIRTLNMVADIYEANRDYRGCKDILLLAYNRASIGKGILYRLTEISLRLGEMEDATNFYAEYEEAAPNDNSRFILKYRILKAQRAPLSEQIAQLEEYKDREYTERWAYELATLYSKNGQISECVNACDDLILWFSEGKYVFKAMELKMQYQELLPSQMAQYKIDKQIYGSRSAASAAQAADAAAAAATAGFAYGAGTDAADRTSFTAKTQITNSAAGASAGNVPTDDGNTIGAGLAGAAGAAAGAEQGTADAASDMADDASGNSFMSGLFGKRRTKEKGSVIDRMDQAGAAATRDVYVEEVEDNRDYADETMDDYPVTSREFMGATANLKEQLAKSIHNVFSGISRKAPTLEDLNLDDLPDVENEADLNVKDLEPEKAEPVVTIPPDAAKTIVSRPEQKEPVQKAVTMNPTPDQPQTAAEDDQIEGQMSFADFNLEALISETADALSSEIASDDFKNTEIPGTEAEEIAAAEAAEPAEPETVEAEAEASAAPEAVVEETDAPAEDEAGTLAAPETVVEEAEAPVAEIAEAVEAEAETPAAPEVMVEAVEAPAEGLAEVTEPAEPEIVEAEAEAPAAEEAIVEETEVPEAPEIVAESAEISPEEAEQSVDDILAGLVEEDGDMPAAEEISVNAIPVAEEVVGEVAPDAAVEEVVGEVDPAAEAEEPAEKVVPAPAEETEEPKHIPHYNEELEIPDPEPTPDESRTHTINLAKLQSTLPLSVEEIRKTETPEERRIRILNKAKPTRMTDEQRKIYTYFAHVPGMDHQILDAISGVYIHAGEHTSRKGNIAIMGAEGTGKSRLSQGLIVNMCQDMELPAAKTARLSGYEMNRKDPAQVVSKMSGGFLIVEDVSAMNAETIDQLNQAMEFRTDSMVMIIEDEKAKMRAFLKEHPAFADKFDTVISIPVFTNDELVTFARTYATENGCKMDEMGVLALYTIIGNRQTEEEPMTIAQVRNLVDDAISRASKGKRRNGKRAARKDKDKWLVLREKDFDPV